MDDLQEQPEHLDQIRDIIFGPQKREFESQFKVLEALLDNTRAQIEQHIASINSAWTRELATLSETVNHGFRTVEESQSADRAAFARTLVEMRSAIDSTFADVRQSLSTQDARLTTQIQLLGEASRRERTELEKMVEASLHETNANIADRSAILTEKLSELRQSADTDRNAVLNRFSFTEKKFDDALQQVVQIAKANISAVAEHVRQVEQSKNADRDELIKTIDNAQLRLDRAIQSAIQSAAEKTASVDATMHAENQRLQQELAETKAALMRELESRASELAETKVSRETMAEALIELGMKVKSGERMSELKLLTKKPTQ